MFLCINDKIINQSFVLLMFIEVMFCLALIYVPVLRYNVAVLDIKQEELLKIFGDKVGGRQRPWLHINQIYNF